MPKKLRDEPIFLAPEILAYRDLQYNPQVIDERNTMQLDPQNVDDKITIYERQVKEWFLDRAQSLCKRKDNNFVVVMIATSYIEGVEQYRNGEESNGNSKRFFSSGMKRIFNLPDITDAQLSALYKHLRCGLFHNGMSGDAVVLSRKFTEAISISSRDTIDINPRKFLNAIIQDFEHYIDDLMNENNAELRNHFDRIFFVI